MAITRREFGRVALVGVPTLGAALHGSTGAARTQPSTPMSRWAGVQVGLNVPYSLGLGNNLAAEDLLTHLVDLGIGSVELRAQPVEHFLGSPAVRADAAADGAGWTREKPGADARAGGRRPGAEG